MSSTRSRSSGFASKMPRAAFERQLSGWVKNLLTESKIQLNLIERREMAESLICRHTRARTRARAQGALLSADFEGAEGISQAGGGTPRANAHRFRNCQRTRRGGSNRRRDGDYTAERCR